MANSSSFVSKYFVQDKWLYAKVDWKDNETDLFHIKIYDSEDCWVGRYSREFAEKYRERVVESKEEYSKNVKAGLVYPNDRFTYDFSHTFNNNNSATFSWKQKFEDDVITMVHGSIPIHREIIPDSKDSLIDLLLVQNKDLKHVIETYEMNLHMLNSELEQSKADIKKFMNVKVSLESSVYGKFISLLNGKKRRIQVLEHNLQALGHPLHVENDVD